MKSRFLLFPPFEDCIENALSIVLQDRNVEIQHLTELNVEIGVIGPDRSIRVIPDPRLDVVGRLRRIPAQVKIFLVCVTML